LGKVKRRRVTISEMLIQWLLQQRNGQLIASHDIQITARGFCYSWYGRTVTPATLDREWRRLRNQNPQELSERGITLKDNGMKHGENTWILNLSL